jgi:hypothetical protein
MTLEVQMMFHIMLLAVCLVCSNIATNKEKDGLEYLVDTFKTSLFFFVPLELLYWIAAWRDVLFF